MPVCHPASQERKIETPADPQPDKKAFLREAEGSVCTHIVIRNASGSSLSLMFSLLSSLG